MTGEPSPLPDRYFQDYWYANESVAKPFCLWSSFFMPHTPLVPQARYFEPYDAAKLTQLYRTDHELGRGFEGHLIRARERG